MYLRHGVIKLRVYSDLKVVWIITEKIQINPSFSFHQTRQLGKLVILHSWNPISRFVLILGQNTSKKRSTNKCCFSIPICYKFTFQLWKRGKVMNVQKQAGCFLLNFSLNPYFQTGMYHRIANKKLLWEWSELWLKMYKSWGRSVIINITFVINPWNRHLLSFSTSSSSSWLLLFKNLIF